MIAVYIITVLIKGFVYSTQTHNLTHNQTQTKFSMFMIKNDRPNVSSAGLPGHHI